MAASYELDEPLATLESHRTTQTMKAVAILSSSKSTKINSGKGAGGAADGK